MSKVETVKHDVEQPALETEHGVDDVHGLPPKFGYRHPLVQVFLVSFICFTCPGMYNALSGLGGGGQIDTKTNSDGSTALNSTFAVMAFFGGTVVNKLGPRLSLTLGTFGYTLYIASLLSYNINHDGRFTIAAGAVLGVCAGLLWTAQGVIMLAYSTEQTKGRYIGMFWGIFNLGAVVGAAVPLAQQVNNKGNSPVENSIYIAFMVITGVGCAATFLLARPTTVRRADGTKAIIPVNQSWITEILNVLRTIPRDPAVLLLFPFFGASNFFYTWQFSFYNLVLFNNRTRALNNLLYWLSQIIGAGLLGTFLDTNKFPRKLRAITGWGVVFVVIVATWGGNYAVQKGVTRESVKLPGYVPIDWDDSNYGGRCFLYIMNGMADAMWQTYSYWLIGAMSNNARKIAVLVGMYKGIQSGSAAVGWALDGRKVPYMNMYGGTFGLLGFGLLIALPMVLFRVRDHTDAQTDELGGVNAEGQRVIGGVRSRSSSDLGVAPEKA